MDTTIDYAPELGRRFTTILEEWLTPAEFAEVRTRNDERHPGVCHSHDFCDANMAMEQAWTDVLGRTPGFAPENDDPNYDAIVADSERDSVLWGRAWNWAIEHYLSHSPTAMALEEEGFPEDAGNPQSRPGYDWVVSSTRGSEPRVQWTDRESIIRWLVWNDPNGSYTEADCHAEGLEPLTLDEARESMIDQTTDN